MVYYFRKLFNIERTDTYFKIWCTKKLDEMIIKAFARNEVEAFISMLKKNQDIAFAWLRDDHMERNARGNFLKLWKCFLS